MQSFHQKMAELKKTQNEIAADELKREMDGKNRPLLVDVRESDEYRQGYLAGALHIPRGFLELRVESLIPDRETPIVTYCAGGVRSLFAAETLKNMGYKNVRSLQGGFGRWSQLGFLTDKPFALSESQRKRYSRHLVIPEVGEKGQAKLLQSRVLLVGTGGLGSPAAYYLAAAGVGTLDLVDFDVVDESNLQRQILHTSERVGTSKLDSAKRTLLSFNPMLNVVTHEERITSQNVDRLFAPADVILDGSDNFPTRYLINDACIKLKKPCVHGSVYRFEGQVTVFDVQSGGPCYRCLYPEPPPAELAPSCAEAGVLGVLPGVIGLLQAVEVIKVILRLGDSLVGRLLTYDALKGEFLQFKLRKNQSCAYCGKGKPFPGYVDYEYFCANPSRH